MPDLSFFPLSRADRAQISALMDEEEQAWSEELGWEFGPVRQILTSFINQRLLPGFVAAEGNRLVGYSYFLIHRDKGIVGALYASTSHAPQETAEAILTRAVTELKEAASLRRIEAQIIPFHQLNFTTVFTRHGFHYYPRYFLELDLATYQWRKPPTSAARVVCWRADHLEPASDVVLRSYRDGTDALICEDYCSQAGCENYLRSLIESPGCGTFVDEASFMALDPDGAACGLVLASRISPRGAMIPQISVVPEQQGTGFGASLVHRTLERLKTLGYRTASLTVTKKNRRALEWYQRLGFRVRKEFGAYIWQRP